MAYEQVSRSVSLVAAADLSGNQFYFIKVDTAGKAALNTTSGGFVDGVLQNKPTSGQVAQVALGDISKVIAGAAITNGDLVMSDGAGKAVTATSTNFIRGRALAAASGAGVIIPVLLSHGGKL